MAKRRKTFADKLAKSREQQGDICPTCGVAIKPIMVVTPSVSERSGAFRFRRSHVRFCSCNAEEIFS